MSTGVQLDWRHTRRIREWEDSKVDSDDDAATVPTGSTGMYDHEIGFEA